MKFSIILPTYNGSDYIGDTLRSILSQSYKEFEVVINDDVSTDDTEDVVKSFKDKRIRFYKNKKNVGYAKNIELIRKRCKGEVIYMMGQDDILGEDALMDTYKAFKRSNSIGAVTRPYFWFMGDISKPVRAKQQLNPDKDEVVKITDEPWKVIRVFQTLDQLSALAYRRKFMDRGFHEDVFPAHIYPFASIFKNHPVVFLKDYNLAVRIESSQTRSVSKIYEKSPMETWVQMVDEVFVEPEFSKVKNYLIKDFIARNFVGLVQLRNFAKYKYLLREIWLLIYYRWENIFSLGFWFFSLGTMVIPPWLLIPMVDWYKKKINSQNFTNINFKYQL